MRVKANAHYIYHANLLDVCDGRTNLKNGEEVKVINMHGCPKANTMGQCYVVRANDVDTFVGMVSTNSLHTKAEYVAYLKGRIAMIEAKGKE